MADKNNKTIIPDELLCAFVDGTTRSEEDAQVLRMAAHHHEVALAWEQLAEMEEEIRQVENGTHEMPKIDHLDWEWKKTVGGAPSMSLSCCVQPPALEKPLKESREKKSSPEKLLFHLKKKTQATSARMMAEKRNSILSEKKRDSYLPDDEEPDYEKHSVINTNVLRHYCLSCRCEEERSIPQQDDCIDPMWIRRHRTTPYYVDSLKPNEVFVFGSSLSGHHGGGSSLIARMKFGAVMGKGDGPMGQSYAIPTMQGGPETIAPYVDRFIRYAAAHPETNFLVTRIGCGTAGFSPRQIAPLFHEAIHHSNIFLPKDFWNELLGNELTDYDSWD